MEFIFLLANCEKYDILIKCFDTKAAICRTIVWRRIEVVITGRTRNAFALRGTRVRIPPSPPVYCAAGFFFKVFHCFYLESCRMAALFYRLIFPS